MTNVDESSFDVGGRRPACLAGDEAEAKRLAGWKAAWNSRICCCGLTRAGAQCKNRPMRGRLTCRLHGPAGKSRHPLKKPPTPMAEHAREMRRLWRADPWADGFTVELDPVGQRRLEAWAVSVGIRWDWLSPRVQDFARWAYVNSCRSGRHPDEDARASDELVERVRAQDRKDGLESGGGHADRTLASQRLTRYRAVPSVGEAAPGWHDSLNGKPRRVVQAAAMQLARDRALAALTVCENREQAVQRQLALDRLRLRAEQEKDVKGRQETLRDWGGRVDHGGW